MYYVKRKVNTDTLTLLAHKNQLVSIFILNIDGRIQVAFTQLSKKNKMCAFPSCQLKKASAVYNCLDKPSSKYFLEQTPCSRWLMFIFVGV